MSSNHNYKTTVQNITHLLEKRAEVYPIRNEIYNELVKAINRFVADMLGSINFDEFRPDANEINTVHSFINQPVFVCGSMKSGTTLITQLLDGHPNLFVMPGDSHYIRHLNRWTHEQFDDIAQHWIQRLINPSGKAPFWFLGQENEHFEKFLQHLNFFLSQTTHDVFVCVVRALYLANPNRSKHVKHWVEKTPHNELHTTILTGKYPHAKFIHVIRNPLPNIASLKKVAMLLDRKNFSVVGQAKLLKTLMQTATANQRQLGSNRYLVLRYEDLVSQPKETLLSMCQFLEIPFDDTLMTPTENGKLGIANSMYTESRVKGQILNQSQNKRYEKELTQSELNDIAKVLYLTAMDFGYDWRSEKIISYRPTWRNKIRHQLHHYL